MHYSAIPQKLGNLRPHQKDAKAKIFATWDRVDAIMLQMPTGTGKTYLFTSLIKDIINYYEQTNTPLNILVVAHRTELIDQISESLYRYDIPHGFIQGSREQHLWQKVQVGSIFSLFTSRNKINVKRKDFDYIIIDEAHHSLADTYKRLFDSFPKAKKLGVTATPWRLNLEPFTSLYQALITTPQVSWFIKEGLLADFEYVSIKPESSIQQLVNNTKISSTGDFVNAELDEAFNNLRIRSKIYESYEAFAYGRKGIIYAINKEHAANLAALYSEKGIKAVAIDCDTPKEERKELIEDFKKGQISVLVNVEIFTEGFDCPDVSFIQLARPTRSLALYLQQVGRGLRVVKGKEKTIIIDNVGLYNYFGLPDANRDWYYCFNGKEDYQDTLRSAQVVGNLEELNDFQDYKKRDYSEDNETMMIVRGVGAEMAETIPSVDFVQYEDLHPITEFSLCERYLVFGNKYKFSLYPFEKKRSMLTDKVGRCVYTYESITKELIFTSDYERNIKLLNNCTQENELLKELGSLVNKSFSQLLNIHDVLEILGDPQAPLVSFYDLLQLIERLYNQIKLVEKPQLYSELSRIFSMKCSNRGGYKAPHKAIYLLSIMDEIESGEISNPRFQITSSLLQQFEQNWSKYVDLPCFTPNIWNPIFYMEDSIIRKEWNTGQKGVQPSNLKRCGIVFNYLEIASDLWEALQDKKTIEKIKSTLIDIYITHGKIIK